MSRIALVTGGSRGIGASISKKLKQDGFTVAATYAGNDEAASSFTAETGIKTYKWDVASYEESKSGIEKVESELGAIDVVVANAGILRDAPFHRMTPDQWNEVIATNLTGTFNLTKVLIKNMIKNRYGRIINISSVSGLMGNPGQVNYSSAKAGLSGFTKSLAKEVGSRGITVNSVAPGFIETDMTAYLDDNAKNKLIEDIPLKRLGSVQDIADLVVFLSSEDASYITGQTISVDGGLFMY